MQNKRLCQHNKYSVWGEKMHTQARMYVRTKDVRQHKEKTWQSAHRENTALDERCLMNRNWAVVYALEQLRLIIITVDIKGSKTAIM